VTQRGRHQLYVALGAASGRALPSLPHGRLPDGAPEPATRGNEDRSAALSRQAAATVAADVVLASDETESRARVRPDACFPWGAAHSATAVAASPCSAPAEERERDSALPKSMDASGPAGHAGAERPHRSTARAPGGQLRSRRRLARSAGCQIEGLVDGRQTAGVRGPLGTQAAEQRRDRSHHSALRSPCPTPPQHCRSIAKTSTRAGPRLES
jgi:hypothetical protein